MSSYYAAVIENYADFSGQVVVDVGAGSGILSLFAAQAGAKHVYAVEASEMAEDARKLIAGNPLLSQKITCYLMSGDVARVNGQLAVSKLQKALGNHLSWTVQACRIAEGSWKPFVMERKY